MIYITGDTHGDFSRFSSKKLRKNGMSINSEDYVIVCGDFGLCWVNDGTFQYNCKNFEMKPYTILWVQGNHENYDFIAEFPVEEWHGGKVRHIVRDKVILLERGQVFEIEGKTFFTFGGASSHDVQGGILDRDDEDFDYKRRLATKNYLPFRILHVSWWPQELPSEEEMEEGRRNLAAHDYKVDYMITHCCSSKLQAKIAEEFGSTFDEDILTDYFEELEGKLAYKHWYFGHYHDDEEIDEKHTLLYYAIVELETETVEDVPVLGKPKYVCGDLVEFYWGEDCTRVGHVFIIDAYGNPSHPAEPSYDIFVNTDEGECLYRHVCESDVIRLLEE